MEIGRVWGNARLVHVSRSLRGTFDVATLRGGLHVTRFCAGVEAQRSREHWQHSIRARWAVVEPQPLTRANTAARNVRPWVSTAPNSRIFGTAPRTAVRGADMWLVDVNALPETRRRSKARALVAFGFAADL